MPSKPYDVVLIPEPKLLEKAVRFSEKISERGSLFTLDDKTFFPHVSLYMLQLNDVGLEKAFDLLSTIAMGTKAVEAEAIKYNYESDYFDIEYLKSEQLIGLQNRVVAKLNPIRDGLRENDKARLDSTAGKERSNILKYGYRSVGDLFSPHLTFTRFRDDQESIMQVLPDEALFTGRYIGLGIYELGDNGTCVHEVRTWEFLR